MSKSGAVREFRSANMCVIMGMVCLEMLECLQA